jgi:hypothetical protein
MRIVRVQRRPSESGIADVAQSVAPGQLPEQAFFLQVPPRGGSPEQSRLPIPNLAQLPRTPFGDLVPAALWPGAVRNSHTIAADPIVALTLR